MESKAALQPPELAKKYAFPKLEKNFQLDEVVGEQTQYKYSGGPFRVKILSLDEQASYTAEKDGWIHKISKGNRDGVRDSVEMYAEMKFYLKYAVVDAPEWWWDIQEHGLDMNVISAVYMEATGLKSDLDEALLQDAGEKVEQPRGKQAD